MLPPPSMTSLPRAPMMMLFQPAKLFAPQAVRKSLSLNPCWPSMEMIVSPLRAELLARSRT